MKKKVYLTLIVILAISFMAGVFNYPVFLNKGINFFNEKFSFELPYFPEKPFKLGLDLRGGSHLVYEADLSKIEGKDYGSVMAGLRDVIERRVNLFGVTEPVVQTEVAGDRYRLIIELAGIDDVSEAIKMIGETPFLEFREPKSSYDEIIEHNMEVYETGEGEWEDPFQPTVLTGEYLKEARLGIDSMTSEPTVIISFNKEGSGIFEELTEKNVGKPLPIYIDGAMISSPRVEERISGGEARITGRFTRDEAKKLAQNLNAGALPVPISIVSQQTVGPTLGERSLEQSLKAGMIGFLAIIIFMIFFYRLPGLLASISLLIYIALVLSLFKLIPVTLTLAGIAGFILSIGMAIDANVLIFSRMREERKKGKDFKEVVEEGFSRAWPSIKDSNLTTLIIAFILFSFGTSFVKGFAFTLGLGILLSLFSAVFVTRNFLRVFINTRFENWEKIWK
jgi:preprotein translocase subunit SecD